MHPRAMSSIHRWASKGLSATSAAAVLRKRKASVLGELNRLKKRKRISDAAQGNTVPEDFVEDFAPSSRYRLV